MKEADIIAKLQKFIRDHDGLVIKQHGSVFSVLGTPDLIGGIPVFCRARNSVYYVHFAVEVKLPGKKATEIQLQRLAEWKKQLFVTGTVVSVQEFQQLIETHVRTSSVLLGVPAENTDIIRMLTVYA